MPSAPFESNRWWFAAELLVLFTVFAMPLALGGAHEWSLWLLLVLSFAATGLWLSGALLTHRRFSLHPVLLLPLAVIAIELLQLVPLPPFLLSLASPRAADWRETTLVPLGLTAWRPISMDAPSTFRGLAKTLSLTGLMFTALQLGRSEAVRRRIFSAVAAVGGLLSIIGFMHLLAGFDALLGVYKFIANTPLITTFGNSNHLAALLSLSSTISLGLALHMRRRDSAIGFGVMALAMGVATLLSFSRGGTVSLLVSWLLVAAYVASRRSGGLRAAFPLLAIAVVIIGAGLLAFDQLETRLDTVTSIDKLRASKIELWPMFATAAAGFARFGMGTGAFELAFSPFQTTQFQVTFTHPENIALQWASEIGVPLGLALLGLALFIARRLWLDVMNHRREAIALLGLFGLFVHEVLDFSLELNALPAVAAVLLGLVASVASEDVAVRSLTRARSLGVFVIATALAIAACLVARPSHLQAEREVQAAANDPKAVKALPELIRQAIDRHPADWVFFATMAQVTARYGDPQNALAWVNRWLQLRPSAPHAHIAAAEALLRLKQRSQALLEYRTAFELGDTNARNLEIALLVASEQHDYERLFIDRPGFLSEAWALLERHNPSDANALLEKALTEPSSEAMKRDAQVLLARTLEQAGQLAQALALLDSLPSEQREASVLVRARLFAKLGKRDEAIGLLERRMTQQPSSVETAIALAETLALEGKNAAAREALQRVHPFVGEPGLRSELFQREAALWSADARHAKALDALITASHLEPRRADLHYRVAKVHEQLGSFISAIDEVQKGRSLDSPSGAQAQAAWLAQLKSTQQNRTAPR